MEEAALSHIINAEGEKIQYVLSGCADLNEVIKVNESVTNLMEVINDLQLMLKSKLRLALGFISKPKHEEPKSPCNTLQSKCDCKSRC